MTGLRSSLPPPQPTSDTLGTYERMRSGGSKESVMPEPRALHRPRFARFARFARRHSPSTFRSDSIVPRTLPSRADHSLSGSVETRSNANKLEQANLKKAEKAETHERPDPRCPSAHPRSPDSEQTRTKSNGPTWKKLKKPETPEAPFPVFYRT